ncbi:hypothetical protein [Bacillus sp. 165]|uniref:hypothetical protein n=1 Tax=Bacillus sp. 165 TaxID=1529117 RepID=UPI001AD95CFA|nr:hypothetical protein [Bacillus sp. 165]MBO9129868.1 hypothetical protein [Bacillus sp. 165]
MYLISALIIGVICGAVPAITGALKEKLEIGMFGFLASVASAVILGFYLSVPVAIAFTYFMVRKPKHDVIIIPFPKKSSQEAL